MTELNLLPEINVALPIGLIFIFNYVIVHRLLILPYLSLKNHRLAQTSVALKKAEEFLQSSSSRFHELQQKEKSLKQSLEQEEEEAMAQSRAEAEEAIRAAKQQAKSHVEAAKRHTLAQGALQGPQGEQARKALAGNVYQLLVEK